MQNIFNCNNFFDTSKTISKGLFTNLNFPWEALPKIKDFILDLGSKLSKENYEEISKEVWISKTAKISNSACIIGPTIIDHDAEIRHCAYIRGSVIIGKKCVVGNSTELKNAILFDESKVPHFNYVGDSILGFKAHFGAGSIVSNVKSDNSNVKIIFNQRKIETGLRKFGAIVSDNVEIGCNAVLNPGTIIGKNSVVYPTSMVRGFLKNNMIFKSPNNIVKKI